MSSDVYVNRPGACLFVYGTLRRGQRNRYAHLLAQTSDFVGPARVRARLYWLESYLGLVLQAEPAQWIEGELFRLRNARRVLSVLDRYEGSGYRRVRALAWTGSQRVRCWIYELRETAARAEPPALDGAPARSQNSS